MSKESIIKTILQPSLNFSYNTIIFVLISSLIVLFCIGFCFPVMRKQRFWWLHCSELPPKDLEKLLDKVRLRHEIREHFGNDRYPD